MLSKFRLPRAAASLIGRILVTQKQPNDEYIRNIFRAYHGNRVLCMSDSKDKTSISPSEERIKGLVDRVFEFVGITNTTFTYPTAKTLLNNCQLASQNKVWYSEKRGRIGKDFRSQHTVLLLHV